MLRPMQQMRHGVMTLDGVATIAIDGEEDFGTGKWQRKRFRLGSARALACSRLRPRSRRRAFYVIGTFWNYDRLTRSSRRGRRL